MMLIELPGNRGQVFAVDPHHVTAVQGFRSTLPGRGGQLFDMTTVWLDNHAIFVCSWSVEHTIAVINGARHGDAALYASGYRDGVDDASSGSVGEQTLTAAWLAHLSHSQEAAP